jgi:replicative DNA helicase
MEYEDDEPEVNDQPDGSYILNSTIQDFADRLKGLGPKPISTGIKAVDRAILGLRPKYYVVGARPGVGKTAFSTSIRRNVVEQNMVVLEFNLEMGRQEIGERELAYRSGVNLRKIMAASGCSPEELKAIADARNSISEGYWWLYDNVFTLTGILEACKKAKRRAVKEGKRIGLVIIDYIGLVQDVSENRQQSISQMSRCFKILSKDLECAVMALTQLNRSCEYRDDKRGVLADIRESGSLEQDGDMVAFLYRENLYDQSVPPEEAEFIIRKQRAGPVGTVRLRFNPRTVHYDDWPPPPPAQPGQVAVDGTPHDSDGVLQ